MSVVIAVFGAATLFLAVPAAAGPIGGAAATDAALSTDGDGPSDVPAAYYGTAEIDGEPLPEGIDIRAEVVIDGEWTSVDALAVDADGSFGGPGAFDEKLRVPSPGEGEVRFVATAEDGSEAIAEETVAWESGDVREVTFSFNGPSVEITAATATADVDEEVSLEAAADGLGVDVAWGLGDETVASGASVTHAYDASGSYAVTATATDVAGNEADADVTVEVSDDGGNGGTDADESDAADADDGVDADEHDGEETVGAETEREDEDADESATDASNGDGTTTGDEDAEDEDGVETADSDDETGDQVETDATDSDDETGDDGAISDGSDPDEELDADATLGPVAAVTALVLVVFGARTRR